jgi:hypothetical protein
VYSSRARRTSGSAAKAAKRTAKGGKYSAKRRQRMLASISSVEKSIRRKARCLPSLAESLNETYPTTIAPSATPQFPKNSQVLYGYHSDPTVVVKSPAVTLMTRCS